MIMNETLPKVYAVKHRDLNIRLESRSGGVFTAISDLLLKKKGIVYGCVLTENFEAVHTRAEGQKERNRMRGSKYIQSSLGNVFHSVKADLEQGKEVLFSGTSCQIAGLKKYLCIPYRNLLCIDIVCHGVPSTKVWKEYLHWQEKIHNGNCSNFDFRNKKDHGWAAHIETLTISKPDGSIKKVHSQVFKTLFYGHTNLRPCCYACPYKSITHPGDITIADYWGIENAAPGFNDNKGVSLVLINNNIGERFFNSIKNAIEYHKCKIEDSMQPALVEPYAKPNEREQFWQDLYKENFTIIAKRYGKYGFKNTFVRKTKVLYKKLKRRLGH